MVKERKIDFEGRKYEQKADTVFNGLYDGKENKLQHAGASDRVDYQRILMIFLGEDTISGSELLCICRAMGVEQAALMALLEGAA